MPPATSRSGPRTRSRARRTKRISPPSGTTRSENLPQPALSATGYNKELTISGKNLPDNNGGWRVLHTKIEPKAARKAFNPAPTRVPVELTIVIPCLNEAETLAQVID